MREGIGGVSTVFALEFSVDLGIGAELGVGSLIVSVDNVALVEGEDDFIVLLGPADGV